MAITAGSRIFIDTNILVFANLAQSPFHDKAVAQLRKFEKTGLDLYINRQVLREYLAVMTRPGVLTEEIPVSSLVQDVRDFETGLIVVDDGPAVTTRPIKAKSRPLLHLTPFAQKTCLCSSACNALFALYLLFR